MSLRNEWPERVFAFQSVRADVAPTVKTTQFSSFVLRGATVANRIMVSPKGQCAAKRDA